MQMRPPSLRRSGEEKMATLDYSWTQKSMLMSLQLPIQDQHSQSHIHNMGQATHQRHETT